MNSRAVCRGPGQCAKTTEGPGRCAEDPGQCAEGPGQCAEDPGQCAEGPGQCAGTWPVCRVPKAMSMALAVHSY